MKLDEKTMRDLFRLDVSVQDLEREGKYPFMDVSECIVIDEDDLASFCSRAKDVDVRDLYAWQELFVLDDSAVCDDEDDSRMTCGILWDLIRNVFLWQDFEEEDLDFFQDWLEAYQKNKGKLLSGLDLDMNQKVDLCACLMHRLKKGHLSKEQNDALNGYLDELVKEGNLWALETKEELES